MRHLLPILLWASVAPAQRRLRHEYVPPSFFDRHEVVATPQTVVEGGEPLPSAVRRDGERLQAPAEPAADAPNFGGGPGGIVRPSEARPDRDTGPDHPLEYHAVFNPTVAPLRRNVSFDAIGPDYRLYTAASPKREVPLASRRPVAGREMFWGDVTVDVRAGVPAGIPSVAPDMRVLAVRAEPDVPVRFLADGADNFYVESPHTGTLRVVFLADADSAYFSAPVPGNVPLDAGRAHPLTTIPATARPHAERVLERLGISPDDPFDRGLGRMVRWFRDFSAGTPPPDTGGDIYEDLALGQTGVCRHRAFAFLVTARAAGVPTRYLQNEAHAFVEVLAPDGRWRRIDLGGEAPSLDVKGGERHRLHDPPPDPFPKPDRYLEQYSAMLGAPPAPGEGPRVDGAPPRLGAGGGGQGSGAPAPGPTSEPGGDAPRLGEDAPPAEVPLPRLADADGESAPPTAQDNLALPVRVRLEVPDGVYSVYRGDPLPFELGGQVTAATGGEPLRGVRVQVFLVRGAEEAVPVGPAVDTDAAGRFRLKAKLPATLDLDDYTLVAATRAAEGYSAGRSDLD